MVSILLLIIIYLSFISLGLPDSLLGSAWPSMYGGLNVPLHYAGFLFMIAAGGTIVSSLLSDRVIKRFGTGLVTSVSVLMTAASLFGFSYTSNFFILCLWSIPLGLGAGSVDAALNNYVALHYKAKHMSWLHCFWGVGATLGPIILSYFLIKYSSWNSGYRAIGVIQTCLVVILFLTLFLWNKNKTQNESENVENKKAVPLKEVFSTKGVKQVCTAFFCYCSIEITAGLWGSSFLVVEREISPEIAAQWIAVYYFGITFGRFISGFLTMKLDNRKMLRLGQVLIVLGLVLIIIPAGKLLLLPGFFIIGLGCAPIYPSLIHETPKNFGADKSQAIIGVQMACAYVGATFMPPLFGKIAEIKFFGFGFFPVFLGIMLLFNFLMIESMYRAVENETS